MMQQIPSFPHYKITPDGRVWSEYSKKFLVSHLSCGQYLQVTLCEDGKKYQRNIHRLVAETYIPRIPGKDVVNHKDENKTNNHVSNLEWVNHQENITYGTARKRAVATVGLEALRKSAEYARSFRLRKVKCLETGKVYPSIAEACRDTGAHHGNLVSALKGRYHTCAGYHWEYFNDKEVA